MKIEVISGSRYKQDEEGLDPFDPWTVFPSASGDKAEPGNNRNKDILASLSKPWD